jgi:hypothetical protein
MDSHLTGIFLDDIKNRLLTHRTSFRRFPMVGERRKKRTFGIGESYSRFLNPLEDGGGCLKERLATLFLALFRHYQKPIRIGAFKISNLRIGDRRATAVSFEIGEQDGMIAHPQNSFDVRSMKKFTGFRLAQAWRGVLGDFGRLDALYVPHSFPRHQVLFPELLIGATKDRKGASDTRRFPPLFKQSLLIHNHMVTRNLVGMDALLLHGSEEGGHVCIVVLP